MQAATTERVLVGLDLRPVIDLYQQPELAARHRIIATPTLLKNLPPPVRQMFGDLSDTKTILRRLGIAVEEDEVA